VEDDVVLLEGGDIQKVLGEQWEWKGGLCMVRRPFYM